MIIAILQPGFMPWLGFFEQMHVADKFIYYDDVQYTRKDWRNRNRLKSPLGVKMVSVPVRKPASGRRNLMIREAEINYDHPWQIDLISKIENWYGKAQFYSAIYPELRKIILKKWKFLIDLDVALIDFFRQILGIHTPCYYSSDIKEKSTEKNNRIIDICRFHDADILYDGKSARDFIDMDMFMENGISVVFQDYSHPVYPQIWDGFDSHLSVLDLLMNCEAKKAAKISILQKDDNNV